MLQIRIFDDRWRNNDVTISCHDNKSVTYIPFYNTINLWKFHWQISNSFGDIGRGHVPPTLTPNQTQKTKKSPV